MAKGNLDGIVRALVGVEREYLGVVADIANRLNSGDRSRWHERFKGVLQEGLPPLEPPPPLLVFDEKRVATVSLEVPHDPHSFWRDTREAPARYVWGTFAAGVVAHAKPRPSSGIVKAPYADLSRSATVRDILALPEVGNYDPGELCHIIASMIAAQPNGEYAEHGLLNDGKGNLFPCGSLLVRVYRGGTSSSWHVDDWYPVYDVPAGRRVFSGNLIR